MVRGHLKAFVAFYTFAKRMKTLARSGSAPRTIRSRPHPRHFGTVHLVSGAERDEGPTHEYEWDDEPRAAFERVVGQPALQFESYMGIG